MSYGFTDFINFPIWTWVLEFFQFTDLLWGMLRVKCLSLLQSWMCVLTVYTWEEQTVLQVLCFLKHLVGILFSHLSLGLALSNIGCIYWNRRHSTPQSWVLRSIFVEHIWNMMAHGQKPDLVFQRNGWVNLNLRGGFSRLLAAKACASAVVMLDTPCSEVQCKTTGYPLHSHVSSSLPLPCVTVCHQVSTELYQMCLTLYTVLRCDLPCLSWWIRKNSCRYR